MEKIYGAVERFNGIQQIGRTTFEEFKAFSAAWAKHISDTVRDGWHEKATVD